MSFLNSIKLHIAREVVSIIIDEDRSVNNLDFQAFNQSLFF